MKSKAKQFNTAMNTKDKKEHMTHIFKKLKTTPTTFMLTQECKEGDILEEKLMKEEALEMVLPYRQYPEMPMVEICVDSVESAIAARDGGAHQVEVCSALSEGGLTPSMGLVKEIIRHVQPEGVTVSVMIRPRGGDFLYSPTEILVMKQDIAMFREAGVDSFVIGVLRPDGEVDKDLLLQFIEEIRTQDYAPKITFHRAFDMSDPKKLNETLHFLYSAKVDRILTSGFTASAPEGKKELKSINDEVIKMQAADTDHKMVIMAGAGININNVLDILNSTNVGAIHVASGVTKNFPSSMSWQQKSVSMGSASGSKEYSQTKVVTEEVQLLTQRIYHAKVGSKKKTPFSSATPHSTYHDVSCYN